MKIALISTAQRSGCPPIGLIYLASHIHKYTDHTVEIIDANYTDILEKDINIACNYDVVGINAMTVNYGKAVSFAKRLKHLRKFLPIVIGGVHISTCPETITDDFNSMIIGEGEQSFIDFLNDVTMWKIQKSYYNPPMENLDNLTPPDWDLLDNRYFERQLNTTFAEWGIEGWLLTSRGCPYRCRFCSTTKFWDKVRFHSVEYVAGLLNGLKKKGVTHIQIWDDLFTIDKNRLRQLQPYMKDTGIKFNCQPRINKIDEETCQILKDSNVTLGIFGFESGNNRVLKYLKNDNSLSIQQSKNAIKTLRKYGIDVQGSIILASPTETVGEMIDTLVFMVWCLFNGVQRLWTFVATPFPKTEFWKYTPKNFDYKQLSHNTNNPLLLDKSVKLWKFRTIMFLAKLIENLFKIKKLIKIIRLKCLKSQ